MVYHCKHTTHYTVLHTLVTPIVIQYKLVTPILKLYVLTSYFSLDH